MRIIMLIEYNEFKAFFEKNGFEISEEQYKKIDLYTDQLVETNKVMNLTGITDPMGITEKHILDSILPLRYIDIPQGASLIDVGTGAGFPGLPIKLYRDDINLTLLDSLGKRVNFLKQVCDASAPDTVCIHSRAEDGGRSPELREKFDVAAARAVAALPVLYEYCLPYVRVGGIFAALKGPNEDISAGENALKLLGGRLEKVENYELPCGDKRVLAVVRKIEETPKKYPRNSGQIAKKSL